jgi:hypothetical protein
MKEKIKICKWCYKYSDINDHKICKSKLKSTLRNRRQNLDLVNTRVDKFSSPIHNQNKYLSGAQNLEILVAYYEIGWLKKDPRIEY